LSSSSETYSLLPKNSFNHTFLWKISSSKVLSRLKKPTIPQVSKKIPRSIFLDKLLSKAPITRELPSFSSKTLPLFTLNPSFQTRAFKRKTHIKFSHWKAAQQNRISLKNFSQKIRIFQGEKNSQKNFFEKKKSQ